MLIYVKSKRNKHTLSLDMLIIIIRRRKKQQQIVNLREMKLDHRNYLDLNEKDLSSGFPTMQDSNQPTQLQILAIMLKFCV